MANKTDFSMIWGSNAPDKYEFTPENYMTGWHFVGSVPPSRTMFDSWMRNADLKMQWLYNNAFSESSLGGFLFWRLPSTAYFVGDLRQLQNGPLDVYLKCTTAGMSSKESIADLPKGKNVGDSWEDGSVTWEIMQFSSSDSTSESISAHNNDRSAHNDFVGATAEKAGVRGMVPAPAAGDEGKFLCADGTFKVAKMTTLELVNLLYPVGIIAEFTNDTDPNNIWPGTTWSKMDAGRVLISAGTYTEGSDTYTYTLGDKGGEAKHPLTTEEMPAHGHIGNVSNTSLTGNLYTDIPPQNGWGFKCDGILSSSKYGTYHAAGDGGNIGNGHVYINASHGHELSINSNGGNAKHENRMPYETVIRWKRTA